MPGGTGRRREHGASAVEFALVVPFLMTLLFGIISYGYMLSFRQAISQGAAEGARAAAIAPAGQANSIRIGDAYERLTDALDSYGVKCQTGALKRGNTVVGSCGAAIASCPSPDTADDCVTVTIDYDYGSHPLIPTPGLGVVMPDHLAFTSVAEVS